MLFAKYFDPFFSGKYKTIIESFSHSFDDEIIFSVRNFNELLAKIQMQRSTLKDNILFEKNSVRAGYIYGHADFIFQIYFSMFSFLFLWLDLNECQNKPCNNGFCWNTNGGYTCSCFQGWTGIHCDIGISIHYVYIHSSVFIILCFFLPANKIPRPEFYPVHDRKFKSCLKYLLQIEVSYFFADVNECLATPCIHGTCSNTLGSYQCRCTSGWSGVNCDIGITLHQPLQWFLLN